MSSKKEILHSEGGEALAQVAQRTVDAPSLAVFKGSLEGTLSSLVWWKVTLPMAGELELDDI